ncbi:MAG TPA: hypothetical protein DCG57_03505 [Candidatus Riflebacteria bacterium]|jgi:hypothetical protein|nr:hypothetical protein [Candidatus Riflebacteria bacterium]
MSENKEPMFEKCSSERMCTWLADRVEEVGHNGKGFVAVYVLNGKAKVNSDNSMILYGVKYRQARGDNGILINHCPFCGQTPGKFAEEMKR